MQNRQHLRSNHHRHSRTNQISKPTFSEARKKRKGGGDKRQHSHILGSILLAKDIRRRDAPASPAANQQRARHAALHLPYDVVVHVAQEAGHV